MHRKRGNKYKKLLRDSKGHKNKHIFTEQSSGGQRAAGREARRLEKKNLVPGAGQFHGMPELKSIFIQIEHVLW